ncbi:hypothetical protein [Pedobacter sp. GR22-6]|uniref:hypothetical protein n=1 Tax=Pedobacter sp. GR22-6 TaxID=3127957 RepID=UPI00307DC92B
MKKRNLFGFIICVSALFACSSSPSLEEKLEKLDQEREAFLKKIESIKDDSLRNDAKKFGSMLFFLKRIDLENQEKPKDTVYEENPFQIMDQYPTVAGLTTAYMNSILVENNADYSSKRVLNIHYPFALPFQQDMNWRTVTFANNAQHTISDAYNETLNAIQVVKTNWNNNPGLEITYPENTDPVTSEPIGINGTIDVVVPKNVLQFKFSKDETGDTQEKSGVKVKLVNVKGHMVNVKVINSNPVDPAVDPDKIELIKVMARDETGGFLDQSGSSTGSDELLERYNKVLEQMVAEPKDIKKLQKQLEDDDAAYENKYKNTIFYKTYYRGAVNEIIVYVLDYSKATKVSKQLNLKTYSFKNDVENRTIEDIPVPTTVYNLALAKQLSEKAEINAADLQKLMVIDQQAYEKSTGTVSYESNAQLTFRYPQVLSTMFLSDFERYGKLKEIKFMTSKGGSEIKYPKDSVDFDDEYVERAGKPWAEYTVNRIEYNPTKFSSSPKYVTGTVEVNLCNVKKSSFPASQLPSGIRIKGNMLIIDESVADNRSLFYVKDRNGKYLKELCAISYKTVEGAGYKRENVHYYYGAPTTVERYDKGELKTKDYKFATELVEAKKPKK